MLLWVLAALFLQTAVLWLFYDRYVLALLPPAIALLACGGSMAHPRLAAALVGVFAVVSLVGVRDHLEYNAALWSEVKDLESRGVPAFEIDGGWTVNGWLQYAHPENAKRAGSGGVVVNHINARDVPAMYQLANAAQLSRRLRQRIAGWVSFEE